MKIELKSSGPVMIAGKPVVLYALDIDNGLVNYSFTGEEEVHQTYLGCINFGDDRRWFLRLDGARPDCPECKGSGKV